MRHRDGARARPRRRAAQRRQRARQRRQRRALPRPPQHLSRPRTRIRRQHPPDLLDQVGARHRHLRRLRLPLLVRLDLGRQPRAERQILQRHLPGRALVAALDDGDGRGPPVGIFQLPRHVAAAEEHLGPDAGPAQLGAHRLVAGHLVAIHREDHDRPGRILRRRARPMAVSAASSRSTPMEMPVAGTVSPVNRLTRSS